MRVFMGVGLLDAVCLAAPTAWMGAEAELMVALVLLARTTASWCWLCVGEQAWKDGGGKPGGPRPNKRQRKRPDANRPA